MRRYRFPLEPVLRVRRIQEDAAHAAMVAARHDLDDAERVLHGSMARYRNRPQPSGPQPGVAWLAGRCSLELSAASVVAAGTGRELAARRMAHEQDGLREAAMRVAALERLDEHRRDEHARDERRDEDAEIDELVTNRHGRTP